MTNSENGFTAAFWWLQAAVLACVIVAGLSVVFTGFNLVLFIQYKLGAHSIQKFPELETFLLQIDQSPFFFLLENLYTIVVWGGILFCAAWLYRFPTRAWQGLRFLLGIDVFITVAQLLYRSWKGSLVIEDGGFFILLNTMQIFSLIVLSHPNVVDTIHWIARQRKPKAE